MIFYVGWGLWIALFVSIFILIEHFIKKSKFYPIKITLIILIMGSLCFWSGKAKFKTESQIEAEAKIEQQRIDDIVTSQLNSAGYNGSEIRSWLSIDYVSQEGDKVTMKHYGDIDTVAMEKLNKMLQNQKEKGELEDYFIEIEQKLVGPQKNRSLITNVVILITLKKE